jgi:hypothetical protein
MAMTHPTLGYTNFRFDGDDAVHMAAFNGAGHVIACDAEGPTEHDLWPHGVDAPVDCPTCVRAREADWWMAQAEQQRRDGAEAVWPEATSGELHNVDARVVSQVNAKVKAAILGTGERTEPWLGVLSMNDPAPLEIRHGLIMPAVDAAVLDAAKLKYHPDGGLEQGFDEASPSIVDDPDAVRLLAERLKDSVKVVHVANPGSFLGEVIDRHDREAKQAQYLARSPLSHLASDAGKSGATPEILIGPASMRDAVKLKHHLDAQPGIDEVEFTHGGTVVDDRDEHDYPDVVVPPDVDALPEPANWCHVHNRITEAGREECSECDGERGEDRKAGES